ncbi:AAA family ATPase [Fibrobacterales bacterium]|nr:AAA family ATPase [Fibrobacterales bacterium]
MKILKLRFANLNSLMGEWSIDFTSADYESDGIFAITGPTGSGKSTILDAICLGIYGQTPRISKISNKYNEVMSRQANFCSSEVEFEVSGKVYKTSWSQKRSRGKSANPFGVIKFEVSDAKTGTVIAEKNTKDKIIELVGMEFTQFTRSILLAQGNFSAFLNADAKSRAPILEQITGTDIYTTISKEIFFKHSHEKKVLEELEIKNSVEKALSTEDEQELKESIVTQKTQIQAQEKTFKIINTSVLSYKRIQELNTEIDVHKNEILKHQNTLQETKPKRTMLTKANSASELELTYNDLNNLRSSLEKKQKELNSLVAQVPSFKNNLEQSQKTHDQSIKNQESFKTEKRLELELIEKVIVLDSQKQNQEKLLKQNEHDLEALKEDEKKLNLTVQNKTLEIEFSQKKCTDTQAYQEKNKQDKGLVSDLASLKVRLESHQNLDFQKARLKKELNQAIAKLETLKSTQSKIQDEQVQQNVQLEKAQVQVEQAKVEEQELLNGLLKRELEKDLKERINEKFLVAKIINFSNERKQLQDDKECPLCGSLEHPFASNETPTLDELDSKINALEEQLKKLNANQEKMIKLIEVQKDKEQEKALLVQKLESLVESIKESDIVNQKLELALDEFLEQSKKEETSLISALSIYEVTSIENLEEILKQLEKRKLFWEKSQLQNDEFKSKLEIGQTELNGLKERLVQLKERLSIQLQKLNVSKAEFEKTSSERQNLFQAKSPQQEKIKLELKETKVQDTFKSSLEAQDKAQQNLSQKNTQIESQTEQLKQNQSSLSVTESKWTVEIERSSFLNEGEFKLARLELSKRQHLQTEIQNVDDLSNKLNAQMESLENQFKLESAKERIDKSLESLEGESQELKAAINRLIKDMGSQEEKIKNNEDIKARSLELFTAIEKQSIELNRWAKLNILIGQANGDKFRIFAQGLTFEVMVNHANDQLQKLSNRYLLVRDELNPLDLNIIDNYQAGEVRTTKNLSGGESFIVSLALALGLSKMASDSVSVGSLFLDEGFGTLDGEVLEIALNTLSSLHEEGKLIGIISHVQELKDRIAVQINVGPGTDGNSAISGPGVKRLI